MKNKWFWRLVLLLIFAGEVFYVVFFFSYFQIKEIKISGNQKVETGAVTNLVRARSIFLVNSKKITDDILSSFPQIAEVKIDRKFPDRLNLTMREREAVANFCDNDRCFLIDKEGIIFESISGGSQLIKILAETGSLQDFNLGENILEENIISLILEIEKKIKENLKIAETQINIL